MGEGKSTGSRAYPTTHWSQIFLAGEQEQEVGQAMLDQLLRKYYPPLLVHLRFKFRAGEDDACDWLQAFIEKKVLKGRLLRRAERGRGRFRTFLLNALDNFVTDEFRRSQRQSRVPEGGFVPLDELHAEAAMPSTCDPFDREWALAILAEAQKRTRVFYSTKGQEKSWSVFERRMVCPEEEPSPRPSNSELAVALGFASAEEVSGAVTTVRRMFGKRLREIVAEYVEDEADIDAEIRDLMAILSQVG